MNNVKEIISGFGFKPSSDFRQTMLEELVSSAINKAQVASLIANAYNKNYPCDISYVMGYTRGGNALFEGIVWLLEQLTNNEISSILSEKFIRDLISLHQLKPCN